MKIHTTLAACLVAGAFAAGLPVAAPVAAQEQSASAEQARSRAASSARQARDAVQRAARAAREAWDAEMAHGRKNGTASSNKS